MVNVLHSVNKANPLLELSVEKVWARNAVRRCSDFISEYFPKGRWGDRFKSGVLASVGILPI